MRAARSRAATHVPINEARRGEEPERIGGLVFERGRGSRKKAAVIAVEEKRETKVAKRRPTLKAPRGRVNNNP